MKNVMTKSFKFLSRMDVLLCFTCALVLAWFPQIDLWVANQFYNGSEFHFGANPLVVAIYKVFAKLHYLLLLVFFAGMAYCSVKNGKGCNWSKRMRYMLVVILLGPGLLVNLGLKDNSFGRPRPVHIEQFGGTNQFVPVMTYSGECHHNCSFVSGHAALGFYFIALAWALGRREWFVAGIAIGALVGLVRMIQGGHFLSDVIFSFWATYFVALAIAKVYRFRLTVSPMATIKHTQT